MIIEFWFATPLCVCVRMCMYNKAERTYKPYKSPQQQSVYTHDHNTIFMHVGVTWHPFN